MRGRCAARSATTSTRWSSRCEDGVPYAIDFMNPAPDADLHSVGQENFDWIVNAVADLAVKKATEPRAAGDLSLGRVPEGLGLTVLRSEP